MSADMIGKLVRETGGQVAAVSGRARASVLRGEETP